MAASCYECGVRTLRVHDDPSNRAAIFEPDVLPGFPTIDRSIDAISPAGRIPVVSLAGTDPDDVWIGRSDGDRADRKHRLFVEDRIERCSVVVSLEYAAVGETD